MPKTELHLTMIKNQQINAESLVHFQHYINDYKPQMKSHYEQLLATDLSRQQWDGCFQRNVLAVIEKTYDAALKQVLLLPFDSRHSPHEKGQLLLSKQVLACFNGLSNEFVSFVVEKHRTSCALSNFPDEHKPDTAYVNEVMREIACLWQSFAIKVNNYFLEQQAEADL
jgi:monoamine oxidase